MKQINSFVEFQDDKFLVINSSNPVPIGYYFVDFIELDLSKWIEDTKKILYNFFSEEYSDIQEYVSKSREVLKVVRSIHPYFRTSNILSNASMPYYYDDEGLYDELKENYKNYYSRRNDRVDWFEKTQKRLVYGCESFKKTAEICLNIDNFNPGDTALTRYYNHKDLISNLFFGQDNKFGLGYTELRYEAIKKSNEIMLVEKWQAPDPLYTAYFEFFHMIKNNTIIKKCRNCGMYFLPSSRIDTLYCDRRFKNTKKTCKEIGATNSYKEKINSNPVLYAYNKTYQSKYAKTVKPYRTSPAKKARALEELKIWQYEAKGKMMGIDKTDGTQQEQIIQEFMEWLKK